jgi:UDP-glucose 4-epimerase
MAGVLVTGADGYLGRVVALRLEESGREVIRLGRRREVDDPGSRRLCADLTDREQTHAVLAGVEIEGVCHLAARMNVRESLSDPLGYFAANVGGTLNLLAALPPQVPFVLLSTGAVYGPAHCGPLTEDLVPQPDNPYAASKLAAESLTGSAAAAGLIGAITLRCFNIAGAYGGRANPNPAGIIPAAIRVAMGQSGHVTINGDGSAVREFTHVLDVADAVLQALGAACAGKAEVLNVGTGAGHTMLEVIDTVARVTGRPVPAVRQQAAPETHTALADTGRIRERLGWEPKHSVLAEIIQSDWEARNASV